MRRDALMKALWPDSFVEEINLTVNVSLLRKTLGKAPGRGEYIVTVPKQGYRFGIPITAGDVAAAECAEASSSSTDHLQPVALTASREVPELSMTPSGLESARLVRSPFLRIAGVVALRLGFGLIYRYGIGGTRPATDTPHTLAVLPFAALSADADGQYLGQGMTDALITRLSSQHTMAVRSFAAVRRFAGTADPLAAGRSLHVESVRRSLGLFQQAIDADSQFAAAYAGLADAYILAGSYGNSFLAPSVSAPKAKEALQHALALDPPRCCVRRLNSTS